MRLRPPSPPPSPRMLNKRPPAVETSLRLFKMVQGPFSVCPKIDSALTRPMVPGGSSIDNLKIWPMMTIEMTNEYDNVNDNMVVIPCNPRQPVDVSQGPPSRPERERKKIRLHRSKTQHVWWF